VAEAENLITSIGEWVLTEACIQQQAWGKLGFTSLDIAINVSSIQFQQPDFVQRLKGILNQTGAEPAHVELELTESVLMNDSGNGIATLKELKAIGVRLAMDDFGTGYSSLAYLHRFPMDTLKIDRAFVSAIGSQSDGAAIASAVIAMGQALRLHVLAEGVETTEQLAFLRKRGCHTFQGYLVSKPLAIDQATHFLLTHSQSNLHKLA
jgi:EAL domain-containing protein (putative c-di-GMP-specific phosphodiesterase class I)